MKTDAVGRGGSLCLEGDASDLRELWPLFGFEGREGVVSGRDEGGKEGRKGDWKAMAL